MTALRILHVDDEADIREVVEISLGFDPTLVTRSCGSGLEALAVALDWQPDIILLDVMMPVMDGPATLLRLRENERMASIPVVFMTARAQTHELDRFRSLGAVGVIPKPFDPMTLAASVRSYAPPADDPLDKLRNVFLQRVQKDAAALVMLQSDLKNGIDGRATLARIQSLAHGLAGAGGIFGFSEVGDAAAALEEAVIVELDGSESAERTASALDRLLARIEANCNLRNEARYHLLDA
jgi:CheY-like chemotaxis protein